MHGRPLGGGLRTNWRENRLTAAVEMESGGGTEMLLDTLGIDSITVTPFPKREL